MPPLAPAVVRLADEPPALTPEQGQALTVAVSPQPVRNIEWVCALAEQYDAARPEWPGHLCERAACLDLLVWQLETTIGDAPQSERLARVLAALGVDATPPKPGRKPTTS